MHITIMEIPKMGDYNFCVQKMEIMGRRGVQGEAHVLRV